MLSVNNPSAAIVRMEKLGVECIAEKLAKPESYGGCKRWLPALPGVTELVIDFLSCGMQYEMVTVERAVHEGNNLFDRGEYLKALDFFAVGYEVFRFLSKNDRYFPLAHDIMLRRVICWSIVGNFSKGLEEVLFTLAIVPNSPTAYFMQGILYSKTNNTSDANVSFQRCVS